MTQEEIAEAAAKRELFASEGSTKTRAARVKAFENLRGRGVAIDHALKAALQTVHPEEK